jgi:hypothetical protein
MMQFDFKIKDAKELKGRDQFIMSMKTTLSARFHASSRLTRRKNFTFFISTTLSLGLIFIPLIELANIPIAFQNPNALNAIQIFLAVSLLVYSVIIGTARYEVRSDQLNDCGDKIKHLIRQLRNEPKVKEGEKDYILDKYQNDYAKVTADVENHDPIDYHLAVIELPDYYNLSTELKVKIWLENILTNIVQYLPILILFFAEVFFITDLFGATHVLIPYLDGSHLTAHIKSK